MNKIDTMMQAILTARKNATPEYGGNVLPAIDLFRRLKTDDDREAFRAALERLLSSENADTRRYAVSVCLGFLVFKDAYE